MASGAYSYLRDTKNYWVYEPIGEGDLLGNLYVDKEALPEKPRLVEVTVTVAA